jgi:hypothetical protein
MMSMRAELGTSRKRLLSWSIAYTPAAALAVLLPKCPLCIAAQLALVGVTIPLPSYARALVIIASVVVSTLVIVARWKGVRAAAIGLAASPSGGMSCGGRCGLRGAANERTYRA